MELRRTNRGFLRAEFTDANREKCSIQESSAVGDGLLWLGVDEPNPQIFPGDGTGWHPYPLPDNVQCSTRMHLSREQARALLPLLERFVNSGALASPPAASEGQKQPADAKLRAWAKDNLITLAEHEAMRAEEAADAASEACEPAPAIPTRTVDGVVWTRDAPQGRACVASCGAHSTWQCRVDAGTLCDECMDAMTKVG